MAAGSDLLEDVYLDTDVDQKVVSEVVGSLESELKGAGHGNATTEPQSAANHVGGLGNISGSHGSSMDGADGVTSAAEPSVTKPGTASGVVTETPLAGKPPVAGIQTLNGSTVVMKCHIPGGGPADSGGSQPAVTLVNNGPGPASRGSGAAVSAAPSSIIRTTPSAQTSSTSTVKSVPTVTLVRPPMQNSTSPSAGTPATVSTAGNKLDSAKHITQAGAHVVASTVTTGTSVRSPTVVQTIRTSVPSTTAVTPPGGIRPAAAQVLAPRVAQPQQNARNIQNIQLPPGMVLVRSESGQLLMIHQQTLAQMQAQSQSQSAMTPRPAAPASTPPVQITSLQAPGASLLARPATPTTIIKQASPVQTTVTATTTLQRPPVLQVTTPYTTMLCVNNNETLENVKKCRNFLSTLIKLASSGKQSSETKANVKELVKSLLEAKIEPEEFTSRLYQELKSSPQPYLVPFLKRSLPALRQMTPDSEAFIQDSLQPQSSTLSAAASTALTAVVLRPPLSTTVSAATSTATTKATVISLTQTPHSKPSLVKLLLEVISCIDTFPVVKQMLAPGVKGVQMINQASLAASQKHKLNEAGGGSFRDDDDINDVASMAGVNLSEESARILATGSELVGMVTRSCKDETFLSAPSLTRIALEIGKKFGVSELGADVVNYISHATQQRLQNLLGKVSLVAQQKNVTFKEDGRYEQVSDVRAQLKFFEQLDQVEKQRKEGEEREILLKAAKSRSRQEDPEQLRLKQKAKEMQQQELAQLRQREANLTALAAIGPRKKRKMDSPVQGASAEGSGSGPSQPGVSGGAGSRQFMRQRITRVNLRDLLFCLENERGTSHSHLLYKGFLK
uniref:TATA-box binding protein associated factor 4 n=1 Tax=Salarias fasciatus TaxID=181472 RepID=A0A672J944_SALFA